VLPSFSFDNRQSGAPQFKKMRQLWGRFRRKEQIELRRCRPVLKNTAYRLMLWHQPECRGNQENTMRLAILLTASVAMFATSAVAAPPGESNAVTVSANWSKADKVSQTVPTTQHLANAFTLRSSPLNKRLLQDLRDLHTNYTRLQLWFSVPNQAVAELKEPTATETFWDFQYIDPVVEDFFANTSGVHHVNMGTIPRWMFNVPPVNIPADPAASFYPYTRGTKGTLLKDPTGKQFADYQARLFGWYTQGGFTDELGKFHQSKYHYKIDIWGIMNEQTFENHLTVQQYTTLYDATVLAIRKIDPSVQFMGPELIGSYDDIISWSTYFLNPKNHDPGALPLSWFTFHNYVMAEKDPATWQEKYFTDPLGPKSFGGTVQGFADQLRAVIKLRDELSPNTKIGLDELGTFMSLVPIKPWNPDAPPSDDDDAGVASRAPYNAYNPLYWVASGGNWAGNFITAENLGIDLLSVTQMVGAPTQSEPCSMINWETAAPNAHYWVLSLVNSNFGPGDKLVATQSTSPDVIAQASITSAGRKVLLVNTANRTVTVNLADTFSGLSLKAQVVDEDSGENPPRIDSLKGTSIQLAPFAVAVVSPAAQ
jgi:hypothetical protein